jgi:putative resolvase
MKLTEWAREAGVHYRTALRWFHDGVLPVDAVQLSTGTIMVTPPRQPEGGQVVAYARVSSSGQRDDLDRQVGRVVAGFGGSVDRVVTEVGSAMNGARPKLRRLLADPDVVTIVVEHRDRLVRFGFDYVTAALFAHGRRVVVIDDVEVDDDLVPDMVEVLTSFCARLYGQRSAKTRARAAVAAAADG